jgi:Family of unknown function (DUF6011)
MSDTHTAPVEHDRCLRPTCRRRLTNPKSRRDGYGRTCKRRIREAAMAEAVAGFKPEQATKAIELIADGGLIATGRPGVYQATSSDGTTVYLCTAQVCGCPAGRNDRLCYHVAAVRIMAAVVTPAAVGRRVFAMAA